MSGMSWLVQLVLLFLFAIAGATFGYDRAFNYVGKVREDRAQFQIRQAKVDLWSYLLTSIPLFGGLMILLGKEPGTPYSFTIPVSFPTSYRRAFSWSPRSELVPASRGDVGH